MRVNRSAGLGSAASMHAKVTRADGTIEHHTSFSRPRPWWNVRGWLWIMARKREYRSWEKADG